MPKECDAPPFTIEAVEIVHEDEVVHYSNHAIYKGHRFVHYGPMKDGDFIVILNKIHKYHCSKETFNTECEEI